MPAKGSSAAALHSPTCLQLLVVENSLEALEKLPALAAEDVGHLEDRPRHERPCLLVTANLHRRLNYSPATAVATAAPAASFLPSIRNTVPGIMSVLSTTRPELHIFDRDTQAGALATVLREIAESLALPEHSGPIERETERVQNHPTQSIVLDEEPSHTALGYQAISGRFRCCRRARR